MKSSSQSNDPYPVKSGAIPSSPSSWKRWQSVQPTSTIASFPRSIVVVSASSSFCPASVASAESAAINASNWLFPSVSKSARLSCTKPTMSPSTWAVLPKHSGEATCSGLSSRWIQARVAKPYRFGADVDSLAIPSPASLRWLWQPAQ